MYNMHREHLHTPESSIGSPTIGSACPFSPPPHPCFQVVVVVSISGGTYVTPYANVVDYTATLLGGGATDDTIRALMSNMTSGATQEVPMVRPSMLMDGGCGCGCSCGCGGCTYCVC
jgi:hypothetical protein